MNSFFTKTNDFASLSLKDILFARDLNHEHLMRKRNVVATAVGLYRIVKDEPWPDKDNHHPIHRSNHRTLFNSEIRPYSWPCVYVFVKEWQSMEQLRNYPGELIARTLDMPDGRSVPVCVIEAKRQPYNTDAPINPLNFYPRNSFVPGSPILNEDAQGMPRLATAGCMVKDGEKYYVLTSKHAVGDAGTAISGFRNYQQIPIGSTAEKGLTRKLFSEIYPDFASTKQYLQMDVGLVEVDDITQWQTKVINVGEVEDALDLYDHSMSLRLIGLKVLGHGAISGMMRGEIQALFYRYKSMGGYEYLTDFLIGPESIEIDSPALKKIDQQKNVSFKVNHGDSGAQLLVEEPVYTNNKITSYRYHPFALLWGKHEFIENNTRNVQPYALASCLSTCLNLLELDFVRDINLDNDFTWGYIGHYAIASKLSFTIGLLKTPSLKAFVEKNKSLLALDDQSIKSVADSPHAAAAAATAGAHPVEQFVPLADVPDNVWKSNVNTVSTVLADGTKKRVPGPGNRGRRDNPNHFADADLKNAQGDTLLSLYTKDADTNLTPNKWLQYYATVEAQHKKWDALFSPGNFIKGKHWGALPFRVWQIVDAMIDYAARGKQEEFFTAGGVLIHYLGDACQPLHSSYLSQGDPTAPVKVKYSRGKHAGEDKYLLRGDKVHSAYEDDMVNANSKTIMNGLEAEIRRQQKLSSEAIRPVSNGFDAACAVMDLIKVTQKTIKPSVLVEKWASVMKQKPDDRNAAMWAAFGTKTIQAMARGCRYLAAVWEGAWSAGQGASKIKQGRILQPDKIQALYNSAAFLPSWSLDAYKLKKNGKAVK